MTDEIWSASYFQLLRSLHRLARATSVLPPDADTGRLHTFDEHALHREQMPAACMLKVTRELHRLFFELHISETPEHPSRGSKLAPRT
jgi:hypothetical protein